MTETSPAVASIVDFAKTAPEVSVSSPSADRLLAGTPRQKTSNVFSDAGGKFFAGVWESTPGKWRVSYSENEFCHVTAGRIRITDQAGDGREFGAGDTFVVPAGFEGTWEVLEAARKLYVIYEP
ncbi:MAG TPA: cupin domain-containing protein [Povalibacter sp.]|uniref:cupin domain-containing protein n=1 Tax=Povalibacter sp. TaxID=1962978 RepID=UPI002BA72AFA|nr:cupin domain-containing protein [Povalibacter sp.]HMN44366.1 cupin domain-containing protein [Povalibacter sp.]